MGLLDGGLQQTFGAAFASVMLDARHYHKRTDVAGNGDVSRPVIVTQTVKGYAETRSDRLRELGYTDKEARLIVMQTYQGRVVQQPVKNDVILLNGVRWIVGESEADGASAAWLIRAARESDG